MDEVMHIDSMLLRGMLDPEDDAANRSEAMHILNSSPHVRFKVSILAIGEVMGKMAEKRGADATAEAAAQLSRLFRGRKFVLYGIGKGSEAMMVADEIMRMDHMITPSDALLAACALVDKECTSFTTTDQRLIDSIPFTARANSRRLRIVDARKHRSRIHTSKVGREVSMCIRKETITMSRV